MAKDHEETHAEEVNSFQKDPEDFSRRSSHADRAAAIVGDERIDLTEEEVCLSGPSL